MTGHTTAARKGGGKGKVGKAKAAAAAELLAACSDCVSPLLTVTFDTKVNEVKTGPYGATSVSNPPYDITVDGGCIQCGKEGKQSVCCCTVTKIGVALHLQINVNTERVNKGVWMNTSDGQDMGTTRNAEPMDSDKKNWRKVDNDSVVTHEKVHCEDLRKFIEDDLSEMVKDNAFSAIPCPDKDCQKENDGCQKMLKGARANIDTRVNAKIKKKIKELTDVEDAAYPGGNLERNARKAQVEDLKQRFK